MKTNVFYILLLLILAVCSCTKKERETEKLLKDPAGTISLDISNTKIDNTIYVEDGNFKGALFCPLGEINGLGYIDKIPKNNWVRTTAVVEGNGYIAWSDGVYYRIFIDKRRGYQIVAKYQYPFDGNIKGIELEKTELSVPHESQKTSVSLENKYLFPFKVSTDASWCTVLTSSSKNNYPYDEISVVLKKNDDTKSRECIINITNTEKIVQEFHIRQQGAPESVDADNDKITLPGTKSSSDILVNSNSDWDAKSNQSWCHAIKNGNYLTISADENHTGNIRSATISLEIRGNSSVKDYITVTQQPIDFQLSVSEIEAPGTGYKTSLTVNAKIEAWDVESTASWCVVKRAGTQILVEIKENITAGPRTARINLFMQGNDTPISYVTVSQKKIDFQLSVSEIEAPGNGYRTSLTVNAKIEAWDVESTASWCVVKRAGTQILVEIKENITAGPRTARINLFMQGNDTPISYVTVSQKKMGLDLSVEKIEVDGCSSTSAFIVNTELEQDWNAESSEPWCAVTKYGNKGIIHIDENDEGKIRKAKISVKYFELEETITVVQDIPAISFSTTEIKCKCNELHTHIDVISNVESWTVSSNSNWCNAIKDGNKIIINVDENFSEHNREAIVFVNMIDGRKYSILVKQEMLHFSVDKDILQFEGCESTQSFSVLSDLENWRVICSEDWYNVNIVGNDVNISVLDNLTSHERKAEIKVALSDNVYHIIKVHQSKPTFNLPENINVKKTDAMLDVPISNVSAWNAQCEEYWCTLTNNGKSLSILIDENNTNKIREAAIIVTLLNETKTIIVRQGAFALGDVYPFYAKDDKGGFTIAGSGVVFEIDEYGFHGTAFVNERNADLVKYTITPPRILPKTSMEDGIYNTTSFMKMDDFSQRFYPLIWDLMYDSDGNKKEYWNASRTAILEDRYVPAINELMNLIGNGAQIGVNFRKLNGSGTYDTWYRSSSIFMVSEGKYSSYMCHLSNYGDVVIDKNPNNGLWDGYKEKPSIHAISFLRF